MTKKQVLSIVLLVGVCSFLAGAMFQHVVMEDQRSPSCPPMCPSIDK